MHSLGERIRTLDVMYGEEMTLRMDIARAWQTVLARQKNRTADLAAARREQELAKGHMEDYARKLETVKIQSSKEQLAYLEKEAADCSEKLEKLQLEQAVSRDDLNLRESMNDYLEYLEEQQKYQAVENTIRHSTDGPVSYTHLVRWQHSAVMPRHRVRLVTVTNTDRGLSVISKRLSAGMRWLLPRGCCLLYTSRDCQNLCRMLQWPMPMDK